MRATGLTRGEGSEGSLGREGGGRWGLVFGPEVGEEETAVPGEVELDIVS